jgi:exosortase
MNGYESGGSLEKTSGNGSLMPGNRLWMGVWALGFVVLFVLLYGFQGNSEQVAVFGRSALRWMAERWSGGGGDLSHGWIIPLVSGFIVWLKRKELAALPRGTCWPGLGLVVVALLLHFVGVRIQQTRISLLSMIFLLWGTPVYLYGWRVGRALLFPAAYLLFCIPFSFLDGVTLPLRLMATAISAFLLNGLGVPAIRVGTAMHSAVAGGFSVDVAEPCSGLRSLLAMLALAAPYAYFTQRGWMKQWVLFLSAVPLAIVGNVARIIIIVAVAHWVGKQKAIEFSHDYSGYVVFVVAVSLLVSLGRLLDTGALRKLTPWTKHRSNTDS